MVLLSCCIPVSLGKETVSQPRPFPGIKNHTNPGLIFKCHTLFVSFSFPSPFQVSHQRSFAKKNSVIGVTHLDKPRAEKSHVQQMMGTEKPSVSLNALAAAGVCLCTPKSYKMQLLHSLFCLPGLLLDQNPSYNFWEKKNNKKCLSLAVSFI